MDDQADLSLHCESRCVFLCLFFVVVFSCSGSFLNMYDFKDQIKDTRIRQSLSIILSISLSFDFFLFLRVTFKYGSNNSPLNNTRSYEIYGVSCPYGFGSWEVPTKSPKCLNHMKQLAHAGLVVVRVYGPWEIKIRHEIL